MSQWYPKKGRVILHIDMNCFYASVEMSLHPKLKGKPVAIAGNPEERKGIIVTSSYEARAKGIKTTMPLWEARKLCPELIVLPPHFDQYRLASQQMFKILADITPLIEPISIDEGYLDITDCQELGHPIEIANNIQKRILDELDLPCSIGIGPNKFLAKMASDMKKPLGITILRIRDLEHVLWPLPVNEMYGVGQKTAEKLNLIDVKTIGDLAKKDVYDLTQLLGINGERLKNRANGVDPRPVDPDAVNEFKSIGSSQTLPNDTTNEQEIIELMHKLSKNVEQRLKRRDAVGLSVQIMIRYYDRKTVTRSQKLPRYIDEQEDIFQMAYDLFQRHWNNEPIRLLGVTMQDLEVKQNIAQQLDLFTYEKEIEKMKLQSTIHKLSEKYGDDTFKKLKIAEDTNQFKTSFQKDFLDDYRK
ncbi:MAG TPA: DNA polymerase IV [Candidatus Dormibacteraeota bacterium]|nr:DNA polymerase IV [Candidatus Dormibacteraeota bacterium]